MNVRGLVQSRGFQNFILATILFNAILLGIDTYIDSPILKGLEYACLGIFVVELLLKFIARESTKAFFRDGWNLFDLVVVISAFVPAVGPLAPVLRVLRVLRVFRLANSIPELRLIVTVLIKSVASMKYIGLLAVLCFYVFGVVGVELFGKQMPAFATLHESLFTLFRVLTGDDWSQLRYELVEGQSGLGYWKPTLFFVVWIVIVTFVLINLIVGAIINNYQEVQHAERMKQQPSSHSRADLDREIDQTMMRLQELLKRRSSMPH